MKKQFFFSMFAAAAMMASCSSENAVAPETGGNEYGLIEGQPAFINIGIAMPSSASTRSNADSDLNDGDADEYAVHSGTLILFKGANEATAKLWKSYNITDKINDNIGSSQTSENEDEWVIEGGSAHITSSTKKLVQEIEAPYLSASEKLYAYVILNDDGNNTGLSYTEGTEFATFSKTVMTAIGISNESNGYGDMNSSGFVMTSVPVCTAPGQGSDPSTGSIQTLTPIDASNVYPTKTEAENSTAIACCYVERAAVKVDVTFGTDITDPAKTSSKIAVSNVTWALGNVNNSTSGYFNTRQVDAAWSPLFNALSSYKWRFVSGTALMTAGHVTGYRTYFGQDVNYDGTGPALIHTVVNDDPTPANSEYKLASGDHTYTYENTFDEDHQIWRNTTYVALKAILNGGQTFYTIDGQNNTALDESSLKTLLATNASMQKNVEIEAIKTKIATLVDASTTFVLTPTATLGAYVPSTGKREYTVDLVLTTTAGQDAATVRALSYDGSQTIGQVVDAALNSITKESVNQYTDGVTYYSTRIAHFGNNETPWNTENASYNNYDKIYPSDGQALGVTPNNYGTSRKAAWLGRWGIVRNNWYSIEITNVKGIGDAVPVDYSASGVGDTPDDNPTPSYFIAAEIHILPWVVRRQTVVL